MKEDHFIDHYLYPGTNVLVNKLGIKSLKKLDFIERTFTTIRARRDVPTGNFDLAHLRAIHKHLFQDVYEWAGEVRKVEINKNGNQFLPQRIVETGMDNIQKRIQAADYFRGLKLEEFAAKIGPIMGDVNYVHPFREGNGRTQMQYLKQLCATAGHALDLSFVDRNSERWIAASQDAHNGHYTAMSREIEKGLLETQASFERAGPDRTAKQLEVERGSPDSVARYHHDYLIER